MPILVVSVPMLLSVLSAAATLPTNAPKRCIIYVDPCTADVEDNRLSLIQESCESAGVQVVPVWSAGYARMLCARPDTEADEAEKIRSELEPAPGEEQRWAERLQGMHVIDVVCGSDAGLECSERMLHALVPARSNGLLRARRDKFLMNDVLRRSGLDAAKQASACEWSEAVAFLERLPSPFAAVLKPRRGSASLRVGLARSMEEAERCFEAVLSMPSTLDESASADVSAVLLQEYLVGEEWIVDSMSRDGEHAVLAIWRYDKGEANGAPFCYYGAEPVGCTDERARAVATYALAVLDALEWRWGPVHMEVMWVSTPTAGGEEERGPVLIEANMGRHNGLEFKLLCEVVYGVSMYDAQLAVVLGDDDVWQAIPQLPADESLRCAGRLVTLVSSVSGTLTTVRHLDEISGLESVARLSLEASEPGERVQRTIDLNTCAGAVILLHADRAVVERDYRAIRALQPTMFEVVEESEPGDERRSTAEWTRLHAEEALRLARDVTSDDGARAHTTLSARFPLLGTEYEVRVDAGSRAAREYSKLPRQLGDALLRAVRSARDEADAMRNCEALVGPDSSSRDGAPDGCDT